jgi:hypothetical protein
MEATLDLKQSDSRDVFARLDQEITRAYEQIALADAQVAKLEHDAPAAVKKVKVPAGRPSIVRQAVRAFTALVLAACIGVAAMAWQSPYGDTARQMIASWAPQLALTSSPPLEKSGLPEQATPSAVQASATEAALPQPAPLAQASAEAVAPAAAVSDESAQLLQSIARDLATVTQEVQQLRASIEQLRAGQEQMSREVARVSEQSLRPKVLAVSAPPPRPAAAPARKPAPQFPARQATAAPALPQAAAPPPPRATAEPQDEPEISSVPRPPMPLAPGLSPRGQ